MKQEHGLILLNLLNILHDEVGNPESTSSVYTRGMVPSRKCAFMILLLGLEFATFFHGTSFLLERTMDRRTTVIQNWLFGRQYLKKRTKLTRHFKENNWQNSLPMIKLKLSRENWNFGKLASATVSSSASQFLEALTRVWWYWQMWFRYCITHSG